MGGGEEEGKKSTGGDVIARTFSRRGVGRIQGALYSLTLVGTEMMHLQKWTPQIKVVEGLTEG